ncbi:hypothetical protein [Nostoc linckia]|uniref:hypothetical protein n=1 Tax=Nostoc linckia TaxID=92942 RepID=UPI0015D4A1A9|nr:hypothetical protein [Nostoc linckia]
MGRWGDKGDREVGETREMGRWGDGEKSFFPFTLSPLPFPLSPRICQWTLK